MAHEPIFCFDIKCCSIYVIYVIYVNYVIYVIYVSDP